MKLLYIFFFFLAPTMYAATTAAPASNTPASKVANTHRRQQSAAPQQVAVVDVPTPEQERVNHDSEYIKEWVNGPSAIPGQPVPQGYASPFTEDYTRFKNSNRLNQLARQLHDRKITLAKALDGLDDNSRAELAHLYRVRFKNENLWTSPNVLK